MLLAYAKDACILCPALTGSTFNRLSKPDLCTHQIGFFWTPHPSTSSTAKLAATRPGVLFVQLPRSNQPHPASTQYSNLTKTRFSRQNPHLAYTTAPSDAEPLTQPTPDNYAEQSKAYASNTHSSANPQHVALCSRLPVDPVDDACALEHSQIPHMHSTDVCASELRTHATGNPNNPKQPNTSIAGSWERNKTVCHGKGPCKFHEIYSTTALPSWLLPDSGRGCAEATAQQSSNLICKFQFTHQTTHTLHLPTRLLCQEHLNHRKPVTARP